MDTASKISYFFSFIMKRSRVNEISGFFTFIKLKKETDDYHRQIKQTTVNMMRHKTRRFRNLFGQCILPCYDHLTPQVGYK